jgi:TonB-dependent receptor
MKALIVTLMLVVPVGIGVAAATAAEVGGDPGSIEGQVADSTKSPLPGARVEIEPRGLRLATDRQGRFTASSLPPGDYRIRISYLGFTDDEEVVKVEAGGRASLHVELTPHVSEEVTVSASRARGEDAALNQQKSAQNIVDVLPAEVIRSLPNTNVADAIGRLPSVSLERDEGEGKYVQVRGLEPRYTNGSINGAHIPSSESGGRQLKLDAIPSDLVGAIELHKTLSADQDGDAIGGSINFVTKSAGDKPSFTVGAQGGYTDLQDGRYVYQFDGTYSNRFGPEKKLGLVLGGTYDWNGRGIDDIEPGVDTVELPDGRSTAAFTGIDYRLYRYQRSRAGAAGGLDYKASANSSLYLRGLFSEFHNYGDRWVTSASAGDFLTPTLTDDGGGFSGSVQNRRPNEQIYSVSGGGTHLLKGRAVLDYNVSYSHARQNVVNALQADFEGPGAAFLVQPSFVQDPSSDGFFPTFTPQGGVDQLDATRYAISAYRITNEKSGNGDLAFAANFLVPYRAGEHNGDLKIGAKFRDENKTKGIDDQRFLATGKPEFLVSQGLESFDISNFYSGRYGQGPNLSLAAATAFFQGHPEAFREDLAREALTNKPNDYDVKEKIAAVYVKDTTQFGRLHLEAGVRIENTNATYDGFTVNRDTLVVSPSNATSKYTDVLPSLSLKYEIDAKTNLRAVYGWAIARPNYADVVPTFQLSDKRKQVSAGNPDLKPTRGQSYDLLFEHYLSAVGVVSLGGFYKDLEDPIYEGSVTTLTGGPFAGYEQTQPVNGPGAKIYGAEVTWQQHLGFLPGVLSGLGIMANYTYTDSKATFDPTTGRTGTARLQRTTPNEFNLNLTYDRGRVSVRGAVTYNAATIWAYQYTDGAEGGPTGPTGDTYLYPHTQIDAQGSYTFSSGIQIVVSALNLNDQVFGFYNGRPQLNIQREFYGRTVFLGFRVNR